MTLSPVSQIIRSRRAIYPASYTGEKIANEKIQLLLENSNWAPTHKRTEPWRFKVLSGNTLNRLSQFLADHYKVNTTAEKFSQTKYKKTLEKTASCSHVILICMQRDPNASIPEWEEIAAVACAVQNMWLTAADLGLGCYWSSPSAISDMSDFLPLDEGERCLGLFYLGIPTEMANNIPGSRGPIQAKTTWINE